MLTRQTNTLIERSERKDNLFQEISLLYFNNKKKFKVLSLRASRHLKKDKTELTYAISGYIHYLNENFKKASRFFLKSIELNPDNFDNWIDLAFSLRHQGKIKMSNTILFYFDYCIHYYKKLKPEKNNFKELEEIFSLIDAHAH